MTIKILETCGCGRQEVRYYRNGHRHVVRYQALRPGSGWWAGFIVLRDLRNGHQVEVASTTPTTACLGESSSYIRELWEKHLG